MKKIFTILAALATFAFVGCTEQSEISAESLPVKCIVTGHVTYNPVGATGSTTKSNLPMGTEVRVFYGIPSGSGVDYAVTTTTIDAMGGFRVDLGCPVGQALKVKCEVSFVASNYVKISGYWTPNESLFFGNTSEKDISAGSAAHFKFTANRVSNLTYPETNE